MIVSIFAAITPAPVVANPDVITVNGDDSDWNPTWKLIDDPDDHHMVDSTDYWDNGYDILSLWQYYEEGVDKLYFMYKTDGIAGDSDRDGNPNTVNDNVNDQTGVGSSERYVIGIDIDKNSATGTTIAGTPGFELVLLFTDNTVQDIWTDATEPLGFAAVAAIDASAPFGHVVEFSINKVSDFMDPWSYELYGYAGSNMDLPPEDYLSEPITITPINLTLTAEYICCRNFEFTGETVAPAYPENVSEHTWNFGDGSATLTHSGAPEDWAPVTHVYSTAYAGSTVYVVLTGIDEDGRPTTPCTLPVYVNEDPHAVADATPTVIKANNPTNVTFSSAGSSIDPVAAAEYGLIIDYYWEFDDMTTSTDPTVEKELTLSEGEHFCGTLTVYEYNETTETRHCFDTAEACVRATNETCTIRVYGRLDEGAGDPDVCDPWVEENMGECIHPENPPYTDPMGPFYPQHNESPRKDFITFDPIIMYHDDPDWNNDNVTDSVYGDCIKDAGNPASYDASEKIFKRMWYEPTEWFKDEDGDGNLDFVLIKGDDRVCWVEEAELHDYLHDGWMIKPNNDDDTCGDIYAPAIKQEFTFMMLDSSVVPQPNAVPTGGISSMLIPAATKEPNNGIDSFDVNGDNVVDVDDAVLIESEVSLLKDIDNDDEGLEYHFGPRTRHFEPLDEDGVELSGDETLVLTTKELTLDIGESLQFFDHKVVLQDVTGSPEDPVAVLKVYYQGHTSPVGAYKTTSYIGEDDWRFYSMGIDNTGQEPQGPFFVHVTVPNYGANPADRSVTLKIGRMFGNTRANVFLNPYWNQKQFYVDMVCYNIVAIKAEINAEDEEFFKYVTIRQKLPKVAVKIPNHTQHLRAWLENDILPELPQYNMDHTILDDVQTTWTIPEIPADKMGGAMEVPELAIWYVDETIEPRFHGELKEIYWENTSADQEFWAIEWIQTLPWEYTQFYLPPYEEAGRYLFTSAFYADEALGVLWDGPNADEEPIDGWWGQRLKFWYEDCTGPIFVDRTTGALRLYGYLNKGPGDYDAPALDEYYQVTNLSQENPAYTDPIAPFYPQADQAPEKDFVTFNPIIMYHNDPDWNNDGNTDTVFADMIKNDYYDASEKVFKRMWYEPLEWYKDEPYNAISRPDAHPGVLDVVLTDGSTWVPITEFEDVEYVARLIDSGVWIEPSNSDDTKGDIYAASIKQEFTYMMLSSSVKPQPNFAPTGGGSSMLIPMASRVNGNGIDSFYADGDNTPDRVIIQSEVSLRDIVRYRPMIMDNDGIPETLSNDGLELSGDETLILTLDEKLMQKNDEIQFFDHMIKLVGVTGSPEDGAARIEVYYMGDATGPKYKTTVNLREDENAFFSMGIENTGENPQGPFFVRVIIPDYGREKAVVLVGRMFGSTHANIGDNAQWNQKQFYVDGVCYNVVAIKTDGQEGFKYITFSQKLPKYPVKIPNHTQHLKQWTECPTILPEMPPYNMNHDLVVDIQPDWSHDKIGPVREAPPLEICWVRETEEPRFHGELKEIYWETTDILNESELEHWTIEWFQTIPFEFTSFMLPPENGVYLVTSAFYAPEAAYHIWDNDPEVALDSGEGARLKWWFNPDDPKDLYVNPPPTIKVWAIEDWYDAAEHGGNNDGDICYDEMEWVNAVRDFTFAFGTGTYPFGSGGIFDVDDLVGLFTRYLFCTQD